MKHVLFASYGNDSMALIQWAYDQGLDDVTVLYSDTGWAADWWLDMVEEGEQFAQERGFKTDRTESIGLPELVRQKKGWPRQGLQFCTTELKILPAQRWLDLHDPDKQAICMVGVRRCESANRSDFPETVMDSPKHGGREVWAPLVRHTDEMRDKLLHKAGFNVLPHRSMECYPCINSNRTDLRELAADPERIAEIDGIEKELGYTSKGKPCTMFRPYRHMKATGIREVVRWAESDRGKFEPDTNLCENQGWCND